MQDLVVLRVTCQGQDTEGAELELSYDLLDFFDEATGFSAMERTTAYPAAIVCAWLASDDAPRGAIPLERSMPGEQFLNALKRRGFRLTEGRRSASAL